MTMPRLCSFTKLDGSPCRDVAAGHSRLCRAHQRQASRDHRRTLALNAGRTVRLGPLDSRAAIQRALNKIIQLLAAGTLPVERAGHALYRIQLAIAAINQCEGETQHESGAPHLEEMWVPMPPPSLCLGGLDLLSLIQPPTIEGTRASSASLSTRSPNRSHHLSSQGPPAYQNQSPATHNALRTTDKPTQ